MLEEAKGDFAAYSHGTMIDPTLYNIRRERRNELCAEAFRWDDLKRWRHLISLKRLLIARKVCVIGVVYMRNN